MFAWRLRRAEISLSCSVMSKLSGEEYKNLYLRGVNEALDYAELEAEEIIAVLDVFGEDGLRWYMIGVIEGIEDREEREAEAFEESITFIVSASEVSILEETEETLKVWIEHAPRDLDTGCNLEIEDNEDELVYEGRVVSVEFKENRDSDTEGLADSDKGNEEEVGMAPAIVTAEKYKYEFIEYEDPDDFPKG